MARNTLKLDTRGLTEYLKKLQEVGGNVQKAVDDALIQTAETIREDTEEALSSSNLPAGGKYSTGTTKESIVSDSQVTWEGFVASIPVGFDFSEPGAGGFLITGTPRMQPDRKLNQMYKGKRYMNNLQKDMIDVVLDYITDAMTGG